MPKDFMVAETLGVSPFPFLSPSLPPFLFPLFPSFFLASFLDPHARFHFSAREPGEPGNEAISSFSVQTEMRPCPRERRTNLTIAGRKGYGVNGLGISLHYLIQYYI